MTKRKAIAPILIVILVALGLVGGTAAGYGFREPLKKMIKGTTTQEEIDQAVNEATGEGQSKFELEGVVSTVDAVTSTVTVKIKSSTNSIKQLQLAEAPIKIAANAAISSGNEKNLTVADILINSQVHMGGTIADKVLTADKVLIQKEDVDEGTAQEGKHFQLSGTVKSSGTGSLTVTVGAASKKAKSQIGKDLEITVTSTTVIEKSDLAITLGDIVTGDKVSVEGTVDKNDVYTASKITVVVAETGETLDSNGRGNSNNNKKTSPTPTVNPSGSTSPTASSSASSRGNSSSNGNSNRGGNSNNSEE